MEIILFPSRLQPGTAGIRFSGWRLQGARQRPFRTATSSIRRPANRRILRTSMHRAPIYMDFLQGTLDMLVLRTLAAGPLHGYGIALAIRRSTEDAIQVEAGSLYPSLQRL